MIKIIPKTSSIKSTIQTLSKNKPNLQVFEKKISPSNDVNNSNNSNNGNENNNNQNKYCCTKCDRELELSKLTSIHEKGAVWYVCENEKDCRLNDKIVQKKLELERKIKEHVDKYKHLPMEEQIEKIYGVKFDDLEEYSRDNRHGGTHYKHNVTGVIYIWDRFRKFWYGSKKYAFDDSNNDSNQSNDKIDATQQQPSLDLPKSELSD